VGIPFYEVHNSDCQTVHYMTSVHVKAADRLFAPIHFTLTLSI